MKTFSNDEISGHLSDNLKSWTFDKGIIKREFKFKNFVESFSFMTAVAMEAEKLNHHPDWCNSYNKVSVSLRTHSENGITKNDFDLAGIIDSIYGK